MPKVTISDAKGLVQETGKGLVINSQMSQSTLSVSAAGPTSPDVSGVNVLLVDTSGNNVTLGGLTGGVAGQIVYIIKTSASNDLILENAEGDAQNFLIDNGDLTFDAIAGGAICIYNGSVWQVISAGLGTLS